MGADDSQKDKVGMNDTGLLGKKYQTMYGGYYSPAITEKRAVTAEFTFLHLRDVLGSRQFGNVLDVGAGEGSLLSLMQTENFGERLYAVEISESGLAATRSRQLARLVEAQLFDGYHIPYPDKYFDLAISIHVLEHVEHERLLLAELARVARHVAIEVPLEGGFRVERSIGRGGPFGHINFYTPSTFLNLLKTSGLQPAQWKVGTSSLKYEQFTAGKSKGFVKEFIRRRALAIFPRLAPFFFTYLFTVYCATEVVETAAQASDEKASETLRELIPGKGPGVTRRAPTWEDAVQWLRSQSDRRNLVLAAYYDDPLIDAAKRYWKSCEWAEIRSLLATLEGNALDVGAGRGIASYALAREGFAVTALEPDPSSLVGAGAIRSLVRESGLPITVVQDFSEKLPFGDGQFDVVFARAVLHHTTDLSAATREFFRVLKSGGRLIAIREHVISRKKDLPLFLSHHPLHHLYGGENAFLLSEYTNAFFRAGFQIKSVISPFNSAINYAPYTKESLHAAVADRVCTNPTLRKMVRGILSLPGIWPVFRRLLSSIDGRPGRLYSFMCIRP